MSPWHYHDPFFQEPPAVFDVDLDAAYARADILKLCRDFYAGIGLPIDDVIARSDLYEKPGKSPHAFCTDIDREGDVRVLANIVPNEYWMGDDAPRAGPLGLFSSKNIPRSAPLRPAGRGAHPDHRRRRHDVRAVLARTPTGCRRWASRLDDPEGVRRDRREDAPRPAADLLALVPGHAPVREGPVRRPRPGSQRALVGPRREVPGGQAAPRAATRPITPARSTSSAPRATTTTT